MPFALTKYQKRLWIVNEETGERLYTPPDFVKLGGHGRGAFNTVLADLNAGVPMIDVVMAFETRFTPVRTPHGKSSS